MVELEPINLHWLGDDNSHEDLCAHGGVYLNVNGTVVSDGKDTEWTLSTASYYLLKTIWEDARPRTDERRHLIPCCGHCMWKVDSAEDGLLISECSNGIDWEIEHIGASLIHRFADGTTQQTSLDEWRVAVCSFSRKVFEFFVNAAPKVVDDKDDREGFELFMKQWVERLDRACKM